MLDITLAFIAKIDLFCSENRATRHYFRRNL